MSARNRLLKFWHETVKEGTITRMVEVDAGVFLQEMKIVELVYSVGRAADLTE